MTTENSKGMEDVGTSNVSHVSSPGGTCHVCYGGVRAMFWGRKFHLKAIFLGLKFASMNFPFLGGKNFQQFFIFSQFNYVIPQK